MNNYRKSTRYLCTAAIIAALYVVLTFVSNVFGLANGAIQIRISEALCVLPFFTAAAVPGVTVGCLITNLLMGVSLYDIIFGTAATFIGVIIAYALRKSKWLVPIPTIVSNTVIIPLVLHFAGMAEQGIALVMFTVFTGELISCGIFGILLIKVLSKYRNHLFR